MLFLAVVALSYRLWKLRQGGTAAILRDTPAIGGQGWRHGVVRYRGGEAVFYRLSSVRWWPDRRLSRRGIEIVSRRSPRGDEFDIMTDEIVVLELHDATQDRRWGYEIALDRGALTAFLSWLESGRHRVRAAALCEIAESPPRLQFSGCPLAHRLAAKVRRHRVGQPRQYEQQV
ncbi:hypothetical protein I552_0993 [Mycobacterium xenopi 3993]|nr:hypothetical protein I552_0993 [Mycobacterium xenopi 3993]